MRQGGLPALRAGLIAILGLPGVALAVAPPPPPPPPGPAASVALSIEFPDGRKLSTTAGEQDCPREKLCGDYYGIAGFVRAGFRKLGVEASESCHGPKGGPRSCDVVAIDGLENSSEGRWVMFRNGYRSPYAFTDIVRELDAQRVVYRFLPLSKKHP
jgi:hypothetical protein